MFYTCIHMYIHINTLTRKYLIYLLTILYGTFSFSICKTRWKSSARKCNCAHRSCWGSIYTYIYIYTRTRWRKYVVDRKKTINIVSNKLLKLLSSRKWYEEPTNGQRSSICQLIAIQWRDVTCWHLISISFKPHSKYTHTHLSEIHFAKYYLHFELFMEIQLREGRKRETRNLYFFYFPYTSFDKDNCLKLFQAPH